MKWEDPPPAKRGPRRSRYEADAAALRANPGRWALLRAVPLTDSKEVYNLSHSVRVGSASAFRPAGAYEATVRTTDGEVRLYVRYVGPSS